MDMGGNYEGLGGWVSWLNMILDYTGYTWNLWMSSIYYAARFVLQNHRFQLNSSL